MNVEREHENFFLGKIRGYSRDKSIKTSGNTARMALFKFLSIYYYIVIFIYSILLDMSIWEISINFLQVWWKLG